MNIGIAAKHSKLEWDAYRLGISTEEVLERYKQQSMDIDKIVGSHQRQKESIEAICGQLPDVLPVDMIALQEKKIEKPNLDMLIAIGGDNFFQICSHYFPEAYLVGVNADPQTSKGALLHFDYATLLPRLKDIAAGNFPQEEWTRVSTTLNGTRLEDAPCTVSLSIKATDMMSRYQLGYNGETEEQKSTGILVVSGAGSSNGAWYRNAGLYLPMITSGLFPFKTAEFSRTEKALRTLTREPMGGEDTLYRWLNMTIKEREELSLVYWSADPSELSLDSVARYEVKEGDRLTFRVSEKGLKVVT